MQAWWYRVCGGLLCSDNEKIVSAVKKAEESVGVNCSADYRSALIKMVELNLINRRENDRERLNRVFGLRVSHNELWKEKKKFVERMMQELDMD